VGGHVEGGQHLTERGGLAHLAGAEEYLYEAPWLTETLSQRLILATFVHNSHLRVSQ